jgi:hypothetical protein
MPRVALRRRKESKPLRDLIGAGVGGFAGLFLAYYLLSCISSDYNVFDLKLPLMQSSSSKPKKANRPRKPENESSSAIPNFQPEKTGHLRLYSAEFLRLIASHSPQDFPGRS